MRAGLVVAIALAACGPSRAAYQLDVDRVLRTPAHARDIPAPAALVPRAWQVGQWTLHAITGHERAYERVRVVAHDACGWWIEHVRQTDVERVEVRACYRAPAAGAARALELLQQITVRRDATDPITLDFRAGAHAATRQQLAAVLAEVTFDAGALAAAPREDVTVPAGTFRGAARVRTDDATRWLHPAVPLGGIVRAARAGAEVVLLGYGP